MSSDRQRDHVDPGERVYRLERRRRDRRRAATVCAACELAKPPYVYLEDGEHYCVECALLVATTEQSYPAAWRAEDITLEELLRERPELLPRLPADRRAGPSSEYDLLDEPKAS